MTRFTSDIQQGKNFLLHFETDNKEHFLAMQNMARKCIDHNTAEVIEVVRCKDCIYSSYYGKICHCGVGRYVNPEHYCSYGERKENA